MNKEEYNKAVISSVAVYVDSCNLDAMFGKILSIPKVFVLVQIQMIKTKNHRGS